MTKTIDSLIFDIYQLFDPAVNHTVSEENLEKFSVNVKAHIRKFMLEAKKEDESRVLRMSSIGKKPRQLWYESKQGTHGGPAKVKKFTSSKLLSFLYGCVIEELVLFLTREAGHEVSGEQKQVELEGVKGSIDAFIDGTLVDVKSASFRSFDKFENGSLLEGNDDFGYVDQLSGYAQAEAQTSAAFVSLNKETGALALLKLNNLDLKNVVPQIRELKAALLKQTPPPKCYEDVAEGSSGNRGLCKQCQWCPYKMMCWQDSNNGKGLQVYQYSNKKVYLTQVSREPNVPNITEEHILGG